MNADKIASPSSISLHPPLAAEDIHLKTLLNTESKGTILEVTGF